MINRTPQELGRSKERDFADEHGLELVSGSGSTPRAKLDVGDSSLLWELKRTEHASYRLTANDILKAEAGAGGPGGKGAMWAFAIEIAGAGGDISVMRTSDLLALARGEVKLGLRAGKRASLLAGAEPNRYDGSGD